MRSTILGSSYTTARLLICRLKAEREVADLMLYGIEFHTFAPTREKLLLLANSVLYFGRRSLFRSHEVNSFYCCFSEKDR